MGYKGYKLYDMKKKKFFISRDVTFVEDVFPFHQSNLDSSMVHEFPKVVLPLPALDFSFAAFGIGVVHLVLRDSPSPEPVMDSSPNSASDNSPAAPIEPVPRRSARVCRPPSYLQEYQCHQVSASHSIAHFDSLAGYLLLTNHLFVNWYRFLN